VRPSPTAGQASLEYVAVISLVAAVLVFAAPAVGAPSLAGQVARGVRLGLCVVAHDYCLPGDAAGDRLPPCALGQQVTGKHDVLSIGNVRFGKNDEWAVAAASDGSVSISYAKGGGAALVAGIGLESTLGVDVGAEASAGFRVQEAKGWRFPDRAAAKRFIAGLPDSARQRPAWRSGAFGKEAGAGAGARALGVDAGSLAASATESDGVRWGPGAALTIYNELSFSAPELKALGLQVAGLGDGRLMVEYTTVEGVPAELAFREALPSAAGDRLTETVKRLDLRNPGNRFVAEPLLAVPSLRPPDQLENVRRVLRWIETEGTIERAVYDVDDRSKSVGFTAKWGEELGFSHDAIRVGQRLLDASAEAPGAKARERFDCLDQLR
jgi:hypothetical protein